LRWVDEKTFRRSPLSIRPINGFICIGQLDAFRVPTVDDKKAFECKNKIKERANFSRPRPDNKVGDANDRKERDGGSYIATSHWPGVF
jgi:hypothetical protein